MVMLTNPYFLWGFVSAIVAVLAVIEIIRSKK